MIDSENIKRIFIRESNWIGDAVMTTPALRGIRESFPKAEIFVAASSHVANVLKHNPSIDEILVFNSSKKDESLLKRLKLFREWEKKYNFDLGILFTNSFKTALEVFIMGIPERVGFDTDGRGMLLTKKIRAVPEVVKKHEVEYFLALAEGLGIKHCKKELVLNLSEEEELFAKDLFARNHFSSMNIIVAIHAGASVQAKEWLPERYARVCDLLIRNYRAQVIIIGSKADDVVSSKIISLMEERALNLAGKTSLRESMAVIKNCDLFIGNNSGPMHIAAALKTPVVAIFGPGVPAKTAPYFEREKYEIVTKPFNCRPCRENYFKECEPSVNGRPVCIDAIEVDDVMRGINLMVKRLGLS